MLNTKDKKHSAVVTLGFAMFGSLFGCAPGRVIELPDQQLKLGPPIQIQPPGATIAAVSQDGRYYAVNTPGGMEVRLEGKSVYREQTNGDTNHSPLMFTNGGSRLVCLNLPKSLSEPGVAKYESLNWASGQFTPVGVTIELKEGNSANDGVVTAMFGLATDPAARLLFAGSHVVLETGAAIPLPQGARFYGWNNGGSLVVQTPDGFTEVRPNGTTNKLRSKPDLEGKDTVQNGQLELSVESVNMLHDRSSATVYGLWLCNLGGQIGDGRIASALVGTGYEIKKFGFIPGHNAVWYGGDEASYVVEYTLEPRSK